MKSFAVFVVCQILTLYFKIFEFISIYFIPTYIVGFNKNVNVYKFHANYFFLYCFAVHAYKATVPFKFFLEILNCHILLNCFEIVLNIVFNCFFLMYIIFFEKILVAFSNFWFCWNLQKKIHLGQFCKNFETINIFRNSRFKYLCVLNNHILLFWFVVV